jgi:Fur family ferric uptake transcriptional regulator
MSCNIVLKEKGFKLTPQRKLILDILHRSGEHITAEDIIQIMQEKMPGVNKSTIYRTLELLEQLDCVFKSELDNKIVYHHAEKGHHHHIVCNSCGKTIDCGEDLFHSVEQTLKIKYGFHSELNHVVISGLCKDCGQ